MPESSVIGLLRVLLTADTAEFGPSLRTAKKDVEQVGAAAKTTEKDVASLSKGMGAFTGALGDASSGVQTLLGSTNPLAAGLGKLSGLASALVSGFGALGPVLGIAAVGVGALAAGAVATVAAVTGVTTAVIGLTTHAANAGDELFTLANKTGLSVEALGQFQFIAQQTDTSVEQITTAIAKLGQNLANSDKKATAAIRSIGLSVDAIRKMKPDEAFKAIITAIGQVPDAGKRAAAGMAIFGRQFREIAQLTKEDLAGLSQQATDLGLVFTEEFAVAGDRFNDAIGSISSAVGALQTRLGAELLPVAIAFVETFGEEFTAALGKAGDATGGLVTIIGDVAVAIAQSLASIMQVAAPVATFLAGFLAGAFVENLGLVDHFATLLGAIGEVAVLIATLQAKVGQSDPVLAAVGARAEQAAAKLHGMATTGAAALQSAAGAIGKFSAAVGEAAERTGERLPWAIAQVREEISDAAIAMRQGQQSAGSFGGALDELGGSNRAAAKAAEDHRKELERLDDALAKRGVLSVTGFSKRLGELVEVLNLAAREGTKQLATAVKALEPEFRALEKAATDSGVAVGVASGIFGDFAAKAGLANLAAQSLSGTLLTLAPSVESNVNLSREQSAEFSNQARETKALEDAYKRFGLSTRAELEQTARQAEQDYARITAAVGVHAPEAQAAFQKMVEAQRAASMTLPSVWETEVFPRIKSVVDNLSASISQGFAAMLTGAASFKEGFVGIWDSIKKSILDILASILDAFINTFLKGLLNAILGQQGAFGKAFAQLFGGAAGGIPGLGGGGLLGKIPGLGSIFGGGAPVGQAIPGATNIPTGTLFGGMPGGAAGTPWWHTGLGGGALGAAAGGAVGFGVGTKTGSALGGAGAGAGTGAAVGALGGPLGSLIGAGVGAIAGWWAAQRARKQANKDRDAYFQAYADELKKPFVGGTDIGSTFNDLAAELTKATGEAGGGTLFKNLLKANDATELANAIAAVNAKLAEYRATTGDAAAAESQHQATLAKSTEALKSKRSALVEEQAGLQKQLADLTAREAPEAHMGTREKLERERIAKRQAEVQAELDKVGQKIQTVLDDAVAQAGEAGPQIGEALGGAGSAAVDDLGAHVDLLAQKFHLTADEARTLQAAFAATTPDQIAALGPAFDDVLVKIGLTRDQIASLRQIMIDSTDPTRIHTLGEALVGLGGTITDQSGAWQTFGDAGVGQFQRVDKTGGEVADSILAKYTGCFGDIGHTFEIFYADGRSAFTDLGTSAGRTADGIATDFADAARQADRALSGIDVDPVHIRVKWDIPDLPDGVDIPGHALGGVFTRPHVAAIAEGGEAEIVGSVGFMTRALEGALSRVGGGPGGASVVVVPAFIQGRPTERDVEYLIQTMKRAEPRITGNESGVRTALRSMTGIR